MYVMTFLSLTHDLAVLQHSSWGLALASTPIGEFVLLCVSVPCYASACLKFSSTSLRPVECLESCYVSVQVTYLLDMLFLK